MPFKEQVQIWDKTRTWWMPDGCAAPVADGPKVVSYNGTTVPVVIEGDEVVVAKSGIKGNLHDVSYPIIQAGQPGENARDLPSDFAEKIRPEPGDVVVAITDVQYKGPMTRKVLLAATDDLPNCLPNQMYGF